MFKEVKIVDIDYSESLKQNGYYTHFNIKLEAIDKDNLEQIWWVIYEEKTNKIYGYEYIIGKKLNLPYDFKYETEDGFSNIYVFKSPEYGKKVDERHEWLDEYLSNEKNLKKLKKDFEKLYIESLL